LFRHDTFPRKRPRFFPFFPFYPSYRPWPSSRCAKGEPLLSHAIEGAIDFSFSSIASPKGRPPGSEPSHSFIHHQLAIIFLGQPPGMEPFPPFHTGTDKGAEHKGGGPNSRPATTTQTGGHEDQRQSAQKAVSTLYQRLLYTHSLGPKISLSLTHPQTMIKKTTETTTRGMPDQGSSRRKVKNRRTGTMRAERVSIAASKADTWWRRKANNPKRRAR
jgi:hypothetical protein